MYFFEVLEWQNKARQGAGYSGKATGTHKNKEASCGTTSFSRNDSPSRETTFKPTSQRAAAAHTKTTNFPPFSVSRVSKKAAFWGNLPIIACIEIGHNQQTIRLALVNSSILRQCIP
jgi:hypothetical protein